MTLLVTGGAGFVGSHMIELLLKETTAPILCLDNFNAYYDPALKRANAAAFENEPRVEIVEADFCDTVVMRALFEEKQVSHVVHLGAYAGVRYSTDNPEPYSRVNVGGTLALLEAARYNPVKRFLLASSSTVYGRGAAIPFKEDAPHGIPASPYGATKRAAELMGLTYHDLYKVPVVCLRPFSVYGPRLRPDLALAKFTDAILRGNTLTLYGDGSIRRDFTHVRDICAGFFAALDAPDIEGETINLGHSDPIEMRQLIALIEEAAGQKANLDRQPERKEDLEVTFADLGKANRLLGYQPQVTFEEGLAEYVAWYRQWHELPV